MERDQPRYRRVSSSAASDVYKRQGRKNYETDKKKGKGWRKGKDCSHTKNGLRYKSVKANRGSKSDTKGDKNARGDSK